MKLILAVLFAIILFFYFFLRLPQDSPLKQWFDKNMVNIGHGMILLWIGVFFIINPKFGAVFGLPLLFFIYYIAKKKAKNKDLE